MSDGTTRKRALSVAGGAGTYGIVWREGRNSSSNVFAAVVPGLPPVAPAPGPRLVLSTDINAHAPEVAWNGTHYHAVWRNLSGSANLYGFYIFSSRIESRTFTENGTLGPSASGLHAWDQARYEPTILPASGGGWHALWHEIVLPSTPPPPAFFRPRLQLCLA